MLPESIRQLIRNFLAGNPFRGEPDDAVWAAVRANDRSDPAFGQALCVLLERAGGPVYAVCRKLLGPGADAEDVFQDAVVALVRKPPRRATFAEARLWLCRVARNKAVDRLNQRNAAGPLGDDPPAAPADPAPHDQLDAVLAAVARLKESYRVPFQLAAIDGLTAAVIADRLGITAETAQKRVERARAKVLRTLAGRGVAPAAAGTVLQSTLTEVGRAALPPDRAATLTAGVLAKLAALPARSGLTKAAAVLVAGLTVGGVGLAGWVMAGSAPEPEVAQVPPPRMEAPVVERETLQAQNLRILKAEVLPKLTVEVSKLTGGGEVAVTQARAEGSEIIIHLTSSRPLPTNPKPLQARLRFCVLTRRLSAQFVDREGRWRDADPEAFQVWPTGRDRPFRIPFRLLYGSLDLRGPFDALPADDRAAAEFSRLHLDHTPYGGPELVVPGDAPYSAGNSRYLFTNGFGHLFARDAGGGFVGWKWVGIDTPDGGGRMAANDQAVFIEWGGRTWVRTAEPAAHPWRPFGPMPPGKYPHLDRFTATRDRLFTADAGGTLWARPTAEGSLEWRKAGALPGKDGRLLGDADRLWFFGTDGRVFSRPPGDGGEWELQAVQAPWTDSAALWAGRLVCWKPGPVGGKVHALALPPAPTEWAVIGRVSPGRLLKDRPW